MQNGLYGGVNAKAIFSSGYNDFMPGILLGFSFFINYKVIIDLAIYYDQSFNVHSQYSTVGMKIGLGLYF